MVAAGQHTKEWNTTGEVEEIINNEKEEKKYIDSNETWGTDKRETAKNRLQNKPDFVSLCFLFWALLLSQTNYAAL